MIRWPKLVFCQNSQQDFSSLCVCVCTTVGVCAGPYNKNRTFWLAPFSLFYTDWCEKERVVPQPNQQRRHMWVKQGGPGHNFVLWVAGKRPHSALDCPAENQTTTTTFLASWFVWLASLHTLSLCVCVCVDTRRGAGSGLAKQKIRKKKSRRKRPIPVYTGHNQCRSHLQHERLLAFRSSFFRQFLSFHYYYLLFDHRRRPFIFEKKTKQVTKWRSETNQQSFSFVLRFSELLSKFINKKTR